MAFAKVGEGVEVAFAKEGEGVEVAFAKEGGDPAYGPPLWKRGARGVFPSATQEKECAYLSQTGSAALIPEEPRHLVSFLFPYFS